MRHHPLIGEVAVVRMPGRDGTQEAWAFVAGKVDVTCDALNAWIAARAQGETLSFYVSRLERINEIPRTSAGKVARSELRGDMRGLPDVRHASSHRARGVTTIA